MRIAAGVLLLLAASLLVPGLPTRADAEENWSVSMVLDADSGLLHPDVIDALERDHELLALTDVGLFRYDGLHWSGPEIGDSLRWVVEREGRAFIGGAGGIWKENEEGAFEPLPDAPRHQRCAHLDRDGRLWAGGDDGLAVETGGQWRRVFDDAVVLCLEEHPRWGLLAGTLGRGLRIHAGTDSMRQIRCPGAGVRDSLPGDCVHALRVLGDGTVRIATSWGDLQARYLSHRYLRERGLVTERDPRSYLRAAVSDWDGRTWAVRPLLQDYHKAASRRILTLHFVGTGDFDTDGREEWLLSLDAGRSLHPRGLVRIEADTGRVEAWLERVDNPSTTFPFRAPDGRTLLLVTEAATDHGNVLGSERDDRNGLLITDLELRVLKQSPWPSNWGGIGEARRPPREGRALTRPILLSTSGSKTGASSEVPVVFEPTRLDVRLPPVHDDRVFAGEAVYDSASGFWQAVFPTATDPRWRWIDPLDGRLRAAVARDSIPLASHDLRGKIYHTARIGEEIGLVTVDRDSATFLGSHGRFARLFEVVTPGFGIARPTSRVGETPAWWVRTQSSTGRRWYATFEGAHPATGEVFGTRWTWPGPLLVTWPSLEVARHPNWSIGPMPSEDTAHLPPDSGQDLFFFRTPNGDIRCLRSTPVDGVLPILDERGQRVGGLTVPAEMRDVSQPYFASGSTPLRQGRPAFLWMDTADHPWRLAMGDPVSGEWDPVIAIDLGYVDLRANGVVALGPNGRFWGTERGLRNSARPRPADPLGPEQRVRHLRSTRGRSVLCAGTAGLRWIAPAKDALLTSVEDIARDGDTLLAANDFQTWTIHGDSIASTIIRSSERRIAEARLCRFGSGWWILTENTALATTSIKGLRDHRTWRIGDDEPLFIDGATRAIRALHEFSDGTLLVGTDWGARFLHTDTGVHRDLFDEFRAVHAITGDDSTAWIADQHGHTHLYLPRSDELRPLRSLDREPARAVEEFAGRPPLVWARTATGVELWDLGAAEVLRRLDLPPDVETLDLELRETQGGEHELILGSDHGLWRSDGRSPLRPLWRHRFGETAVERVLAADSTLFVLSQRRLYRLRLPAAPPTSASAQLHWEMEKDILRVGAWRHGRVHLGGIERRVEDGTLQILRGVCEKDGTLTLDLGPAPPGRQRLQFRAYDDLGWPLGAPWRLERVRRTPSAHWATATLLLPAALLGLWAFDLRRRWPWALAALASSAAFFYCGHEVYCHTLPAESSLSLALGVASSGLILRWRERQRRIPPALARERLDDLLRAFRHRGGGVNPVDEWLLLGRNVDLLAGDFEVDDDRLLRVLKEVLEATAPLARDLQRLALYAELEPTLLRRFAHRLHEMRDLAADLAEDSWRRQEWKLHADDRLATGELCTSFLRSVESVSELVRRHAGVDLLRTLPLYAARVRERHGIDVTLDLPRKAPRAAVSESALNEVLENLEGNALRAMAGREHPRIHVRVRVLRAGRLRLEYEDEGPGIPPELRKRVLERGFSTTGSTGFGLTRCAQLANNWGGGLELQTGASGGLRVVLSLPTRSQE